MKEKKQEKLERNMEDLMYADLWAKDREAKDLKDTREKKAKRNKSVENCRFIRDQILKNQLETQKQLRGKEHDLAVMVSHFQCLRLSVSQRNYIHHTQVFCF